MEAKVGEEYIVVQDDQSSQTNLEKKFTDLKNNIRKLGSILVAYSGGVDSTFLLKVCVDTLGKENVLGVTAESPIRFRNAIDKAEQFAEQMDARYRLIETVELKDDDFKANDTERCYYCKRELFGRLKEIADNENLQYVVDGTNADDIKKDDRPGLKAHDDFSIKTPLADAGLSKDEIRKLSRRLDLPTWNQPSDTCLATRFSYSLEIDNKNLDKLRKIELFLREFDFTQVRARLHDSNTIRIEVLPDEMNKIMENREEIWKLAKEEGFEYIALDLEGYRSGSMNETVN